MIKEFVDDFSKDFLEGLKVGLSMTPTSNNCNCKDRSEGCKFKFVSISGKVKKRNTLVYDEGMYCRSCGILNKKGSVHHWGCDVEVCPICWSKLKVTPFIECYHYTDSFPIEKRIIKRKSRG